jgi:anthraniloyl-CoA monooxygenase
VFNHFTFSFQHIDAGWLWFHAYPTTGKTSTCIVECTEETWLQHGFDQCDVAGTIEKLEKILIDQLDGAPLISQSRSAVPADGSSRPGVRPGEFTDSLG